MVGVSPEDKVTGVCCVSITDSPGVGTRVDDKKFLSKFDGTDLNTDYDEIDGITSATYSSNGGKDAVKIALETFKTNKEAITVE